MKYPQNRTLLNCILVAITILLTIAAMRSCQPEPVQPTNIIKAGVAKLKQDKAKVKVEVVYRDSIRTKHIHHWHTIRRDSLIPCETKLLVCDTILVADSSMIASLYGEIQVDNLIIAKQDTIIKQDSITIVKLNKSLKRQKRLKWLFLAGGVIGGGLLAR